MRYNISNIRCNRLNSNIEIRNDCASWQWKTLYYAGDWHFVLEIFAKKGDK